MCFWHYCSYLAERVSAFESLSRFQRQLRVCNGRQSVRLIVMSGSRSSSARAGTRTILVVRRNERGERYQVSALGRVEGVMYSVRMIQSVTGIDIGSFDCWDYSLASICATRASLAILFAPSRCSIVLEGTLLDEVAERYPMSRVCSFNCKLVG